MGSFSRGVLVFAGHTSGAGLFEKSVFEARGERDGLNGLAEAHLVRDEHAPTRGEPKVDALALERHQPIAQARDGRAHPLGEGHGARST